MPTKHLTAKAFIAGVVGMVFLHLGGFLLVWTGNQNGFSIGELEITRSKVVTAFLLLVVTAFLMFGVELAVRIYYEKRKIFSIHPKLRSGRPVEWLSFLGECFLWYLSLILLLYFVQALYLNAHEYRYADYSTKYKPWHVLFNWVITTLIWGGGPYIVLTRALQYNADWDRKEPVVLLWKCLVWTAVKLGLFLLLPGAQRAWLVAKFTAKETPSLPGLAVHKSIRFNKADSQTLLGVFVKAFYIPLMTVFFVEQASSLFGNWEYILVNLDTSKPEYTFRLFSKDLYNISYTFIFVVDVGLAWGGYVLSSRWIKNGLKSVEPTFIGWGVAIFCYPPFNSFLGTYYSPPSDKDFLAFGPEYDIFVFAVILLSIFTYLLYMSATVCFGLRFSNLTNRGIITTGPFRFVRHPAYTGKNISWWLVMFPVIIIQCIEQLSWLPVLQLFGLILMTTLYYYRAITEERHLLNDPDYVEYCQKVPWRFIPGVM